MAKKVDGWLSTTGKICETEHEAVCDELRAMMVSSDAMNAASASLFLVWMVSEPQRFGEFRDLLTRMIETDPSMPVAAAPANMFPARLYNRHTPNDGHTHAYSPRRGEQIARCIYCDLLQPAPEPPLASDVWDDPEAVGQYRG